MQELREYAVEKKKEIILKQLTSTTFGDVLKGKD